MSLGHQNHSQLRTIAYVKHCIFVIFVCDPSNNLFCTCKTKSHCAGNTSFIISSTNHLPYVVVLLLNRIHNAAEKIVLELID